MRELSVGTNLVAGVKTTVYTVPDKHYAKWNLLYVINNGANNKNISAWWYDSSVDDEIQVLDSVPVSTKQYLKFDGGAYVVLEAGDQIRLQSEAAAMMSAINTFELIPSRTSALS